jgi:hypothetical protein
MEESSTYQAILEQGRLRGAHRLLLLQGTERFGPPSAEIRALVDGIKDLDRLDQLSLRILKARSWQELLESPR